MTAKKLAEKQKNVLETIKNYIEENGKDPTIKTLTEILGYKSYDAVQYHLKVLNEKGYFDRKLDLTTNVLTDKQKEVLNIIKEYISKKGFLPNVRELCDLAKLSSTSTMHDHLARLEAKGYITKEKDSPRTIRIIKTA